MRPGIALVTAGTLVATGCQVAVAPAAGVEPTPVVVAPAPHRVHAVKPKPKPPKVARKVARKVQARHHVTVRTVPSNPVVPVGSVHSFADLPRVWQRVVMCESSGQLHQMSRTGKYGGAFQIERGWWRAAGLDPRTATWAQQYALALRIWREQGWAAWTCARIVGII